MDLWYLYDCAKDDLELVSFTYTDGDSGFSIVTDDSDKTLSVGIDISTNTIYIRTHKSAFHITGTIKFKCNGVLDQFMYYFYVMDCITSPISIKFINNYFTDFQ